MKKVLMIGDAGTRTGFARVVKSVADRLHATGDWEVSVRGINYIENHGIEYEYDVQPITFGGSDPIAASTLPYHVDDVKPDVIWCLQDPWHLQAYAVEKPKDLPSVAYVPVDTPCMKWEHGLAMGAWSQLASYTQFGAREMSAAVQEGMTVLFDGIRDSVSEDGLMRWLQIATANERKIELRLDRLARVQNPAAWNIVPHGRDTAFEPRDKQVCRREFGIPEDGFVVGMVGGNMVRKRIDTAIRAFAQFAEGRGDALLVLHCFGDDQQGWDIAALAHFYGVADRMLAVHWQWPELTDDQLCSLYNTFDVFLNTSSGEGWGLPITEAALCAVPLIVPDHTAPKEIWAGDMAFRIPVVDYLHFEKYLNTAHAVLDVPATVRFLERLHGDPELRDSMGAKARQRALDLPTWDEIGDAFGTILGKAMGEGDPTPTSINHALAARKARIRSTLLEP